MAVVAVVAVVVDEVEVGGRVVVVVLVDMFRLVVIQV